jgi:hypothetical protein
MNGDLWIGGEEAWEGAGFKGGEGGYSKFAGLRRSGSASSMSLCLRVLSQESNDNRVWYGSGWMKTASRSYFVGSLPPLYEQMSAPTTITQPSAHHPRHRTNPYLRSIKRHRIPGLSIHRSRTAISGSSAELFCGSDHSSSDRYLVERPGITVPAEHPLPHSPSSSLDPLNRKKKRHKNSN